MLCAHEEKEKLDVRRTVMTRVWLGRGLNVMGVIFDNWDCDEIGNIYKLSMDDGRIR